MLAEHGGPFEFNAEDFAAASPGPRHRARRVDELSPSGQHLWDYNPHGVRVEPLIAKAKAGAEVNVELIVENERLRPVRVEAEIAGKAVTMNAAAGQTRRIPLALKAPISTGRHVFSVHATEANQLCPADAFGVIDVE